LDQSLYQMAADESSRASNQHASPLPE